MSSLRDRHVEATRREIIDAVVEVVTRDGIDTLTFAAVAEQAGVGERTVYRHYPSREALLDALDAHVEARLELGGFPEHKDDVPDFARRVFRAFDAHAPLVEASLAAAAVRPHGQRRRAAVLAGYGNPVIDLLVSATAWERLRRLHGMDGATAGETVARALERLLEDEHD
jgi:AcrR family transcriptional regulator